MSDWTHTLLVVVPEVLIPEANQLALAIDTSEDDVNTFRSAVIFGRPDHTVSGEVGYAAYLGKRWALITQKVIDTFFGVGHCQESIEWDEINKPQFKIWK